MILPVPGTGTWYCTVVTLPVYTEQSKILLHSIIVTVTGLYQVPGITGTLEYIAMFAVF